MVALGNNRNNGQDLGAFYLNANNALGNSNGNNWRSRAYYREDNLKSLMSYLGWLMATCRTHILLDKIKEEKNKCKCTLIRTLALAS